MVGKDEFIFNKSILLKTSAGKKILKEGLIKSQGYKQFIFYKNIAESEFPKFTKRYTDELYNEIMNDTDPLTTSKSFSDEVNDNIFSLDIKQINQLKSNLLQLNYLQNCVNRLFNSNFIKMTLHIFYALYDSYQKYLLDVGNVNNKSANGIRENVIDGHIIAIDLSEPMDRIQDKDEDLEFLEYYKLICPYMLKIARKKISHAGNDVREAFENGFRNARIGQEQDNMIKKDVRLLNEESMIICYKKYRSVIGTAGQNMALNKKPFSTIFYIGMAKASECVGCGNEIQDSIRNGYIKIPSWPLLYTLNTGSAKKGFELTLEKSYLYLKEAELALEMLPKEYKYKPFLEFLFLTVKHYNEFWFNQAKSLDIYDKFERNLKNIMS